MARGLAPAGIEGKTRMAQTITLTDEQIEIIGYALMQTRRAQQAKLDEIAAGSKAFWQGIVSNPDLKARVDGYRERIERLEDAAHVLPPPQKWGAEAMTLNIVGGLFLSLNCAGWAWLWFHLERRDERRRQQRARTRRAVEMSEWVHR